MDDVKDKSGLTQETKQTELFQKLGMIESVANGAGVCVSIKKAEAPVQLLANSTWAHSKQVTDDLVEQDALVHFSSMNEYDHIAVVVDPEARASFSEQIVADLSYRAIEIVDLIQMPVNDLSGGQDINNGAAE